jgi:ArsR family transcriptional regulator
VARAFDHVQLGFEPAELWRSLESHGLEVALCEPTLREKRPPHFDVITLHARKREKS